MPGLGSGVSEWTDTSAIAAIDPLQPLRLAHTKKYNILKAKLAYLLITLIFLVIGFGLYEFRSGPNKNINFKESNSSVARDRANLDSSINQKQVKPEWFKDLISYNKTLKEVTPASAHQMLAEFNASTADINKRANFATLMIVKLCQKGYSNEAYSLIDPSYGDIRKDQLVAFFEKAELDEKTLFDLLGKKNIKGDLQNSLFGFMRRFKPEELEKILSSSEMKEILEDAKNLGEFIDINNPITSSFAQPDANHESIVQAALNLNSKGLLDPNSVMSVVGNDNPERAFEKWSLVKTLSANREEDQTKFRNGRELLIRNMVRIDAQKAMREILAGSLEDFETIKDIRAAVGIWSQVDARGGYNWYTTNKKNYSQKQQTVIATSFSSEAYSAGEFEVARQWINEIQDPEARASGLKALEDRLHPSTK
jgi:hypothetical protein